MPDVLNNKEGPQQRSPPSASTGGAMEKDWSNKLFDHQLQEAWKKTDRAITPAVEAVCIPAQLAPLSQAAAPPSCSTLTGAEVPQAKKKKKKSLAAMDTGLLWLSPTLHPCGLWPARLLRRILQVRIVEHTGQYYLPYPSRALYLLLS